jgi:hypothetical protein
MIPDNVSMEDAMKTVRSVRAHEVPSRPPIQLAKGDNVQVGEQDTTWPAFVFVTAEVGSGWVPSRYIDTDRDPAVMTEPYDTTELPTSVGDVLAVVARDDLSGWLWVRDAGDHEGWVPRNTVEPLLSLVP